MGNKFKLIEGNCALCGKFFSRKQYIVNPNHGLFCSIKCAAQWKGEQHKEIRFCVICGQKFKIRHSDYKMTCSPECKSQNISRAFNVPELKEMRSKIGKRNKGKVYPNRRKPLTGKICIQCGKEYFLNNHIGKKLREKSRFCSKDCWYEYIREDSIRHPGWKGGYQPYYGPNWDKQRKIARERDNYTCQDCNRTENNIGQELDVHHITPFRLFGIKQFKEANHLSNLISLCKSCHSRRQE